jgi:ABC-2 type transport system permease protein
MSELVLAPAGRRTTRTAVLVESATLTARAFRLSLRNVEALIMAVALPIMLMVLFVYLFGGALNTGTPYVDYVVPGVMLVCAGFGAGTTAVSVAHDLTGGIMDRFRSLDVRGEALIQGQVVASVLRNLFSSALVLGVALAIGFRSDTDLAHWLAALGILTLFIVAVSWLAAALGILAKNPEGASGLTFLISFLPYPSSAFVPIHTMPSWLRAFAEHQPVTPVIDSIRALLLGGRVGSSAWQAIIWSVAITAASVLLAGLLFRRRTAA